ncbi:uncharacterized protein EV420DRAFT_222637 [Desarmillaria tabescens]|uniref:Uncharacterized protein n=1 Tax=Armillaria tabescens TaxID=1929756 RepID=A0AA39N7X6_ARMTA|nr:uncharacterized protein EV420DRAFT_222637 [Desarmillaria tabescens]KAK0460668.1 hypothetical protein EV420DRAFT_222637 [Desarmillaria tabescens]
MDLLWSLDNVVAAIVTSFIVLGFLVVVATTVLPCLVHLRNGGRLPCAYRSPQSWAFLQATLFLLRGFKKQHVRGDWLSIETSNFQNSFDRFAARGVSWLDEKFSQNLTMVRQLFHCISDLGWNNFRSLECVPEVPIRGSLWMRRCLIIWPNIIRILTMRRVFTRWNCYFELSVFGILRRQPAM